MAGPATVAEQMTKGRQVAVPGGLEHRQWEGSDGSPPSKHEIIANQSSSWKGPGPSEPVQGGA